MSDISIIVPVYKVEKYLSRCVESILCQTYKDFDFILVDDGSPDNCGKMCDDYAAKDSRIHVIHQKNGGLPVARNSGIEWVLVHSNSKWITFVDSDDWIHPRYLELLINFSEKYNVSICMAECLITDHRTEYQTIPPNVFSIEKTEVAFKDIKLDSNAAWARLYRKELFSNIRFPIGKLHEDRFTTYKLYFQFEEVGVIHTPLYYYFINNNGITHAEWNPRKLDNLEAAEQQLDFFRQTKNDEMYLYILEEYVHLCIIALRSMGKKKEYMKYQKIVRNKLRKTLHQEHDRLRYNIHDNFNIYKYAYPFLMKVYNRLFR